MAKTIPVATPLNGMPSKLNWLGSIALSPSVISAKTKTIEMIVIETSSSTSETRADSLMPRMVKKVAPEPKIIAMITWDATPETGSPRLFRTVVM